MKTRGLIDLYLPARIAYHLKILAGGVVITMFFNMIWRGTAFPPNSWIILCLVICQLEIFMLIANRIFRKDMTRSQKSYKSRMVTRLLIFYLLVLVIAFLFMLVAISPALFWGNFSLQELVAHLISVELRPVLISWIIGVGVASVVFFYFEWAKSLKQEQMLREEKLIFQYETLKNQVNPHFLFNSLNTLGSLVSTDPPLAEKFISKFSSIYRYILENKDRDFVDLPEEIKFVENYFFLQKLRDNGKIELRIDVSDRDNNRVVPISLQLLVENALKHNAATLEHPLLVRIYRKDDMTIVVENRLQRKTLAEPSSRLGLKNLAERITLLMDRKLVVTETTGKFRVELPVLKLDENENSDH